MLSQIFNSSFFSGVLQLTFFNVLNNDNLTKIDFTFDHVLKCFRYNEESTDIPIIFVPGYKGSSLKTVNQKIVWIDTWSSFSFLYTPNLSLPLNWRNDKQDCDDLKPHDIIRKVTAFSFTIKDIYDTVINQLQSIGRPLYCYNYDWRRDLHENKQKLEEFIVLVNRRHGNNGVQIVSHSMGGLITYPIINSKPELFCSALFISTPFQPGLYFLKDFHEGAQIAYNNRIFAPEVLASFSSHWIFLPNDPLQTLFYDESGGKMSVNILDVNEWMKYNIGIFQPSISSKMSSERQKEFINHLRIVMQRTKEYRKLISYSSKLNYPSISIMLSRKYPTENSCKIIGNPTEKKYTLNFENSMTLPGDERVPADFAYPPRGVPVQKVLESNANHIDMCKVEAVVIKNEVEEQLKAFKTKKANAKGKSK